MLAATIDVNEAQWGEEQQQREGAVDQDVEAQAEISLPVAHDHFDHDSDDSGVDEAEDFDTSVADVSLSASAKDVEVDGVAVVHPSPSALPPIFPFPPPPPPPPPAEVHSAVKVTDITLTGQARWLRANAHRQFNSLRIAARSMRSTAASNATMQRLSHVMARKSASLHKRVLKAASDKAKHGEPQLKLETFTSADMQLLFRIVWLLLDAAPVGQLLWVACVQVIHSVSPPPSVTTNAGPSVTSTSLPSPGEDSSTATSIECAVQVVLLVISVLYVRRIYRHQQRQAVQLVVSALAAFVALVSFLFLVANTVSLTHVLPPTFGRFRSILNTLIAGLIFHILTYVSDHYRRLIERTAPTTLPQQSGSTTGMQRPPLPPPPRELLPSWLTLVIVVAYMALRVGLAWQHSIVWDFVPLTNVVTMIRLTWISGRHVSPPSIFLSTWVLTAADLVMLAIAWFKCGQAHQTFRHVFVKDFARIYTEFSVFVLYFQRTVVVVMLAGQIIAWTLPFNMLFEATVIQGNATESAQEYVVVQQTGAVGVHAGMQFSLTVWLIFCMFSALPADSVGWRGWLAPTRLQREFLKHFQYFLYEADVLIKATFTNFEQLKEVNPAHLVMEQQIELFNFAFLVYACGNADYEQGHAYFQKLVGNPEFEIVAYIHEPATDTHCLILQSESKIVVTFRGTSSRKNAKTDLKSAMTPHATAMVLDLRTVGSKHSFHRITRSQSRRSVLAPHSQTHRTCWQWLMGARTAPKVHAGFYAAYASVAERVLSTIQALHRADPRRVLVTGHSLGGALAALCSFDVVARLKITNVQCTTFGCPRIGNATFQRKYQVAVPATFAFVNASDMITKLPPRTPRAQPYVGVGTVVLINAFGNLVIDPHVLEFAALHRGYSAGAHSLKAYQYSLLLWCLRGHNMRYHPEFWAQSLSFLRAEYGHVPEVKAFLDASVLITAHLQPVAFSSSTFDLNKRTEQSQLAPIVRMLRQALELEAQQQRRGSTSLHQSMPLQVSLGRFLSGIFSRRTWYATNDALRILKANVPLESEAAALEFGRVLVVHGYLQPEGTVFTRNARFCFRDSALETANDDNAAVEP
ncbi:TPA: hypothetical protein N0F65_008238 [Lagenidium giganteum]|uniref:Fungal lipase-type domain-containing protein n=1 Tax=Lagenidium giganteum TaxID=4803 RepID=A0AAV2YYQ7_9STRA|nr:TPA: hypothetical protein N0F65_008238 [Lagenidium giganteum]